MRLRVVGRRLWEPLARAPSLHQVLGGAVEPAVIGAEKVDQVLRQSCNGQKGSAVD